MKNMVQIREAEEKDAEALLKIYAPYVEKTAITFEYEVPSLETFQKRIHNTLERYPYLVAELDGAVCGYAYTGPFHERPAYDWAVETSIYVDSTKRHEGIGRSLHDALERELRERGFLNMYACIACPEVEDEYLTRNSIEFHSHLGYEMIGEFHKCGYKFNRWYNMVWMEKIIGTHTGEQKQPRFGK